MTSTSSDPDEADYYWTDQLILAQFRITFERFSMIPTVGRVIHVKDPAYPDEPTCQAALVTGVDYGPRVPQGATLYVAIFSKRGDQRSATIIYESPSWHDPVGCPNNDLAAEALSAIPRG